MINFLPDFKYKNDIWLTKYKYIYTITNNL